MNRAISSIGFVNKHGLGKMSLIEGGGEGRRETAEQMKNESDHRISDELAGKEDRSGDSAQSSQEPSQKESALPFEPTSAQKLGAVKLRMEILRRLEAIRVRNRKAPP